MSFARLAVDAAFRQFGRPASWSPADGGDSKPVRVIAKRPDTTVSFGDTTILTATTVFEVRATEAPTLREADRLILDEVPYAVQAVRRLDPDRLVWTVEAYALAPDEPAPPPEPLPESVVPGLWDGAYSATADAAVSAGQVVVLTGSGHLLLARADRDDTADAAGVVVQGAGSGHAAQWTVDRPVERVDWAMVLESGQARLVPGVEYFLSAHQAGGITDTPPDVPGAWVVPVGRAVSATVLHVALGQPVRL